MSITGNYKGFALMVGDSSIEAVRPFACGWYGEKEDDQLYFQWLVDGWDYMMKIIGEKNKDENED